MPGFRNIPAWAGALADTGQHWVSSFRKVPAVVTIAGQWFDYSTAAGMPVPNYYASSPLTAALLEGDRGIQIGPDVSPAQKWVHRWTMMNGAQGATVTTSQNQPLMLLDYLLYYPFVDMDAAGEQQDMDNTQALTRNATGDGVRMMMVAQAQTIGGGQFTVGYTNQDGVSGRVTPTHFCAAAQPYGALVSSAGAAAGIAPFLMLQAGDRGVRSVEWVNFSVANGGLCALVLVKPLVDLYSMEEARVSTGTVESFGSVSEWEAIRHNAPRGRIYDDSYVSFIGQTTAGSVSGAQMVGMVETVWG